MKGRQTINLPMRSPKAFLIDTVSDCHDERPDLARALRLVGRRHDARWFIHDFVHTAGRTHHIDDDVTTYTLDQRRGERGDAVYSGRTNEYNIMTEDEWCEDSQPLKVPGT